MAQVILFLSQVVTSQYSLLIARSSQCYSLSPFSVELSIWKCMHAHVSIAIFFSGSVIRGKKKKSWPEKCSSQSRYGRYSSYASESDGQFQGLYYTVARPKIDISRPYRFCSIIYTIMYSPKS